MWARGPEKLKGGREKTISARVKELLEQKEEKLGEKWARVENPELEFIQLHTFEETSIRLSASPPSISPTV